MSGFRITVEDRRFVEAFRASVEEWRLQAEAMLEHTADKVVERARELVPKRTGRLAESIHAEPMVRTPRGASITVVAGGPGIRETVFVEFGTSQMRAEPYMRPALAMAAGALRSAGVAARLSHSNRSRLFARRALARRKIQRAQRRGLLHLSPAEARVTGKFISSRLRFRGERRRR